MTGIVKDKNDNNSITAATVDLQSTADSSSRYMTLSDTSGRFSLQAVPGSYILQVSAIGFESLHIPITLADSSRQLGVISLFKDAKLLDQVVVKAVTPPVKQKGDTLEYSSGAFKVNPDANAEDMIRKMPGITIEQGTVKAGGENVKKVTVDGRDFFGDDATAALKNLPAEIIDKIQVFDRLSEQAQITGFEDDNTANGINIVTKANMRNGQFGRVFAGYGTDNRYSAGGNVSFFNGNRRISLVGLTNNINIQNFATEDLLGVTSSSNRSGNRGRQGGGSRGNGGRGFGNSGNFLVGKQNGISKTNAIGVNFSDLWEDKISVTGSYFFNNSNNTADETLNRQYFIGADSNQLYNERSFSSSGNDNHRINMRMEYKIDSFNTLIITPNFSFQKNQSLNSLSGVNILYGKNISETDNINYGNSSGYNFSNNVLFRHAFPKKGRSLTFNLSTAFNNHAGDTYLDAASSSSNVNGDANDSLKQFTDRFSNGYQLSGNLSYTEPIGKKGQLQISYHPSFSRNHSDQRTFQYAAEDKQYSLFDTSLSNKFDNSYTTQNGSINYRINNKKNMLSVGLAYQHAELSSDQVFPHGNSIQKKFANILPNAMWNSKLSARSSLRISYRTATSAPSVMHLQNVINNINPLNLRTGNPDLQQQFSNNMVAAIITPIVQKESACLEIYSFRKRIIISATQHS